MAVLLRIIGISKSYSEQPLIRELNLEVNSGDVFHLDGPNGSGKSTLLKILVAEATPDAGSVEIHGRIASAWLAEEREELCPYVDQDPLIELDVPAVDNLIDSTELGRRLSAWLTPSRNAVRRRILEEVAPLAHEFGLHEALLHPARNLSYGQRRLLTILRALRPLKSGRPRVLLLDEPLAGLHADRLEPVLRVLDQRQKEGWAILIAEHGAAVRQLHISGTIRFPIQ
jgi:ABC-type multidrug transport system ATPase subunit